MGCSLVCVHLPSEQEKGIFIFPSDCEAEHLHQHFLWELHHSYSHLPRTVFLCWNPSNFFNPIYVLSIYLQLFCITMSGQNAALLKGIFSPCEVYSFFLQIVPGGIYTKVLLVILWVWSTVSTEFLMESILCSSEWGKIFEFMVFWRTGSKLKAGSSTNCLHNLK